jgi:hypothetical protein
MTKLRVYIGTIFHRIICFSLFLILMLVTHSGSQIAFAQSLSADDLFEGPGDGASEGNTESLDRVIGRVEAKQIRTKFEADFAHRLSRIPESQRNSSTEETVYHGLFSEYSSQAQTMPRGRFRRIYSEALGRIGTNLIDTSTWREETGNDFSGAFKANLLQMLQRVPGQQKTAKSLILKIIPEIYSQLEPEVAFKLFVNASRDSEKKVPAEALKLLLRMAPKSIYSLADYVNSLEKKNPSLHAQLIQVFQEMSSARPFSRDAAFRVWADSGFFAAVSGPCANGCLFESIATSLGESKYHYRRAVNSVADAILLGKLGAAVRMIQTLSDIAYKRRDDPNYPELYARLTELNSQLPEQFRIDLLQNTVDRGARKIYRDTPTLQQAASSEVTVKGTLARWLGEPSCHQFYHKLAYTPEVRARNAKTLLTAAGAASGLLFGSGIVTAIVHTLSAESGSSATKTSDPTAPTRVNPPPVPPVSPIRQTPDKPGPTSEKWRKFLQNVGETPSNSIQHLIREQLLNGKNPDFEQLTEAVWDKYLEIYNRTALRKVPSTEFAILRRSMLKELKPGGDPVEFKSGIENAISNVHPNGLLYNQKYTNPVSTLMEGKDQCSATSLCRDLLMREHFGDADYKNGNPVYIFENGHVLNGVITKSGELIGFDGTVNGPGLKKYGPAARLSVLKSAIRVVEAEDVLLADLFARELSAAEQQVLREALLQATANKFSIPLAELEKQVTRISPSAQAISASSPLNHSLFSFGTPDTIEGDVVRPKADEVPVEKTGLPILANAEGSTTPSTQPELHQLAPEDKGLGAESPQGDSKSGSLLVLRYIEPTKTKPKELPGGVIPISSLGVSLADDLENVYSLEDSWNANRVLVRHGSSALIYTKENFSTPVDKRLWYIEYLPAYGSALAPGAEATKERISEDFEKLCRTIGDPIFTDEQRIHAIVHLMSLRHLADTESALKRVKEKLPSLYEAALRASEVAR